MFNLDWLIAPFDKKIFIESIWQKTPQLLVTNYEKHFKEFFNKESLEKIIEFSQPQPPSLRFASSSTDEKAEVPYSLNGRIDVDRIRKLYLQGETLVLNSVEDFDPLIAQLARSIETEMGARVQVNSYLTPCLSQGFSPHYDTHDVLVLQVEGEKHWKVYGQDSSCPLNELIDGDPKFRESAQPPDEIHLKEGDVLYIPRGWVHEAKSGESASLHVTIGIHPPLGKDLLQAALDSLVAQHPALRQALPYGPLGRKEQNKRLETQFSELVALFNDNASVFDAAEVINDQFSARGRSGGDGHLFKDIEKLSELTTKTTLQRRTNMPCFVCELDDGYGLKFLNRVIRGPVAFKAAMDFVATCGEPFTVSELPGIEEEEHQFIFATSLVADGLCYLS